MKVRSKFFKFQRKPKLYFINTFEDITNFASSLYQKISFS